MSSELADTRKALFRMQKERDQWKALADRLYGAITRQLSEPADTNSGTLVELATMIETATKDGQQ